MISPDGGDDPLLNDGGYEGPSAGEDSGTVWDNISATQPNYPGTELPRSFELNSGETNVWVHGNATEHIAEYLSGMESRGTSPDQTNLALQARLSSLSAAVDAAGQEGIEYDQLMHVGGWELIFGEPSNITQLPVLYHATYSG
jgi:hypothetical protein